MTDIADDRLTLPGQRSPEPPSADLKSPGLGSAGLGSAGLGSARLGSPSTAVPAGGTSISIVTAVALALTGAFAGGGLLTQTVIVPHWREMAPAEFLDHFSRFGPATGTTLFPIEILSVLLLGIVCYSAVKGRKPGRLAWGVALACMVGTVLLLPIYFLGANAAMLTRSIPLDGVVAELQAWYAWNWLRTGLAFLAVIAGCTAFGYRGRVGG